MHADGVQAFVAGHPDKAARLIAQAIAANGRMPDFHYNLAIVLKAQGKLKQAAASYSRAIALKPDYAEAHNNLGNVWKDLGEPDKARASFERALAISPGNSGTHYSLGLLCGDASASKPLHISAFAWKMTRKIHAARRYCWRAWAQALRRNGPPKPSC